MNRQRRVLPAPRKSVIALRRIKRAVHKVLHDEGRSKRSMTEAGLSLTQSRKEVP